MSFLNADVPVWECLVRSEFLHDMAPDHRGEFERATVFGLSSVQGRALGFHVITETGCQFARLPIHALVWKKSAPCRSLSFLQLWDCFSYEVSVHVFSWLDGCRVKFFGLDKKWHPGQYMFTVDWCGSHESESAGELGHKSAHILKLDDGNFAAQPNNRCRWYEPAFVTKPFPERPTYKTNSRVWICESRDDSTTEDSDLYFYGDQAAK